ncbi:DUF2000 domain-containing protein [Nocardioides sp. SOB77]|uniref:DUF2000 domain-containing protein n=1 Tax=Nocardioides oceani TaxID=3058369 RepID=A0ABT8FID9_9ACTN|nr:DUF2000 domain-containing protein [Nocardioides oceani]MDN4174457.1 DUF2000 domain-containing protein [Nocardioides oceani]
MSTEILPGPAIGFTPEQIDQSASTRDVRQKWVVVVDEALPPGRAVNAAVCVAGATTAQVPGLLGADATDADGTTYPGLPWLGCTVLGAPAERLGALRAAAGRRTDVAVVAMPVAAQLTRVYDDYLEAVASSAAEDLSFLALSLVGPRKVVDRLVKGLGLLP